jgi:hypothetical protein
MRCLVRLVFRIATNAVREARRPHVSVELTIVVLWMVFPIGLACVASGRIGRALAQLRQAEGS